MSYANFKDPVGLLKRMLASGNKAAYFTLLREGMSILLKPLDAMWQSAERKKLAAAKPSKLPLIIILGGSRSGTTVLYQTLAHYLPVSYFNNLSVSFPRSPISSSKFFKSWFGKKRKQQSFANYYGSVSGFNGPNDAFHIWNRWLGEDRNAIPEEIPEAVIEEMRNFFNAWHAHMGQPFLNKNNRNSLCVDLFLQAFEHVQFVEIRRNPVFVVQSLIQSREAVQGSKHVGWGLGTKEASDQQDDYAYIRDIVEQVHGVEQGLNEARNLVPESQYTYVSYEDFCENPGGLIAAVYEKAWPIGSTPLDLNHIQSLKNTNRKKLGKEEFERILQEVKAVYGGGNPEGIQTKLQSQ